MKKGSLLLYCLVHLLFHTSVAQDFNSKNGYIITLAGDTVRGLVKDKANLNSVVSFKSSNSNYYRDYAPSEIKSFYFEGGYRYESLSSPEIEQKFFLQVYKGTLTLYQDRDTLYILSPKNEFLELKHHKDQTVQDISNEDRSTKYRLVEDKRYIRTLVYLTSDCPRVKGKMEKVSYTAEVIAKLLSEYEVCINPDAEIEDSNIARTRIKLGFRAGANTSSLNYFVDAGTNLYYGHKFESQLGYLGGISANISYGKKFSVQAEIIVAHRGCRIEGLLYESPGAVKRRFFDTTRISMTYLEIPITAYYTLPVNNLSPYVGLGGSFSTAISDKSTRASFSTTADPFGPDSNYTVLQRQPITSNDLLGLRVALGVRKELSLSRELRLEYTFDSSLMNRTTTDSKARWQTHQMSVYYLFSVN